MSLFGGMKMYNIAICDDELDFGKLIATKVKDYFSSFGMTLFDNPDDLLEEYQEKKFEVVFMDIDMPSMSGYELAEQIRTMNRDVIIAFITGTDTPVDTSLKFRPIDFIRKGSWQVDILQTFPLIEKELLLYYDILVIGNGVDTYHIKYGEILYFESNRNDLLIHKKDGIVRIRKTLKSVMKDLLQHDFIIINKGIVINTKQVRNIRFADMEIIMKNGETLYIGRTRKKEVKEFFSNVGRNF